MKGKAEVTTRTQYAVKMSNGYVNDWWFGDGFHTDPETTALAVMHLRGDCQRSADHRGYACGTQPGAKVVSRTVMTITTEWEEVEDDASSERSVPEHAG